MYNMLLDIDCLDKNWDTGTPSNWKLLNDNQVKTQFAISKLNHDFTSDEVMKSQPKVDCKMKESKEY